ncbi:MAG: sortase [Anaerolineae bacterium]
MSLRICPYLGTPGGEVKPYPSYFNRCHVTLPPQAISSAMQSGFCLTGNNALCPRFRAARILAHYAPEGESEATPSGLEGGPGRGAPPIHESPSSAPPPRKQRGRAWLSLLLLMAFFFACLCLGGAIAYFVMHGDAREFLSQALSALTPATPSPISSPYPIPHAPTRPVSPPATPTLPLPQPTDTPTMPPSPIPSPSPQPTDTPKMLPSPTPSPSPTATLPPSPTPSPSPQPSPTPAGTPLAMHRPAEGPPTRLVIPAIGLDTKVVEVAWKTELRDGKKVSVWEVADYAAGFHKGTAYPGHVGNTVLSGHHNIKGKVFRYLIKLKPGDEVYLYVGDVPYHYIVTQKFIFPDKNVPQEQKHKNARWISPTNDERLTLVTCWPYTNNTHRVVVVAKPAAPAMARETGS